MTSTVKINETGWYRTRTGLPVNITIVPVPDKFGGMTLAEGEIDGRGLAELWYHSGKYHEGVEHIYDLVEFCGESKPEPRPVDIQFVPRHTNTGLSELEQYRNSRVIELAEQAMVALIRSRATLIAEELANLSYEIAEQMVAKEQKYGK